MLSEQRALKSVTIDLPTNTAEVLWVNQVLRDGTVIAENYHRTAYSADQKDIFMLDVEGAAGYVTILGW